MKTNIRDFINSNRESFDDREPNKEIWRRISSGMFGRKLWDSVVVWRSAAMLLLALTVGLYVGPGMVHHTDKKTLNREFNSVESYYLHEISEKVSLIDQHREGLNGYTNDFHQLEAMYAVLKEQMQKEPNEKVRDALVLNLLVRVDLLNQELQKLEQRSTERKDVQI